MIRTTPALMERVGLPNWLINEDPFEASFRPDTEIMSAQQSDTYLNEIVIAKSIKQLARSIQGNRKTKQRRQHNPLPDFLHPNYVVHMCVFDCDPIREVTESFGILCKQRKNTWNWFLRTIVASLLLLGRIVFTCH